jgi:hypothetical protein
MSNICIDIFHYATKTTIDKTHQSIVKTIQSDCNNKLTKNKQPKKAQQILHRDAYEKDQTDQRFGKSMGGAVQGDRCSQA